jgi:hypothetical protein
MQRSGRIVKAGESDEPAASADRLDDGFSAVPRKFVAVVQALQSVLNFNAHLCLILNQRTFITAL